MGRPTAPSPEPRSGRGPLRSCVACRTRRPPDELIRLALVSRGRLCPDLRRALPGRGAWVCPSADCIGRIEAHSRLLGRALKRDPGAAAVDGLRERVRLAIHAEIPGLIRVAAHAGLVDSGAARVRAVGAPIRALVCATDASARSTEEARAATGAATLATIGLDRVALGRLVGRGPRAVLAVRDGTPGDALVYRLRWLGALG